MKIVLATGIFPPDVGGPSLYCEKLAEGLQKKGMEVTVITYGDARPARSYSVIAVSKKGDVLTRWRRYAGALQAHASDSDYVYAFSSISVGIPIILSGIQKPKKILRLGGDFFWERYTDNGGMKTLHQWYEGHFLKKLFMSRVLSYFDEIVFSTQFQEELYEGKYKQLPPHRVIENAGENGLLTKHVPHSPFKLLYLGRFVGFKNLSALVRAMNDLPNCTLTMVGSGPMEYSLRKQSEEWGLSSRIFFSDSKLGSEKERMWQEHDLLVIPSLTEISPNSALEARSAGLPVLLTHETGLSTSLTKGMVVADLRDEKKIKHAVEKIQSSYDAVAAEAVQPLQRTWEHLLSDHLSLFV